MIYSEWRDERQGLVRWPLQLPRLEKMKAWPGSALAGWFPQPACGLGSQAFHGGGQLVVQEAEPPMEAGQESRVGSSLSPRLRLGCPRGKAAFVSSGTMLTDFEFAASRCGCSEVSL